MYRDPISLVMRSRYIFMNQTHRKALFGCSRVCINPHVLGWMRVELELNSTLTYSNTCGLRGIRQHPNKAYVRDKTINYGVNYSAITIELS
jgi:hypothetical protein